MQGREEGSREAYQVPFFFFVDHGFCSSFRSWDLRDHATAKARLEQAVLAIIKCIYQSSIPGIHGKFLLFSIVLGDLVASQVVWMLGFLLVIYWFVRSDLLIIFVISISLHYLMIIYNIILEMNTFSCQFKQFYSILDTKFDKNLANHNVFWLDLRPVFSLSNNCKMIFNGINCVKMWNM